LALLSRPSMSTPRPPLNLEGAVLRGMDLAGAQLWYANLRGADLTEARLVGADLRYALLIGAFLEHADLSGADLTRAVLVGAKLAHSQLVGATLSHSLGPRVDLRCSILDDATLDHAMMQEADLREVMLRRASLLGCKVPRSDLRGAVLEQVNLRNADLYEAQLQGANLKSADLRWANLSAANLESASLQEANLEGAMVVWQGHFGHLDELPNYNPASFFGADITNANLEGIIPLEQASLIRIVSGLRHPKVAFRSERVRQAPQATRERLVLRTAEGELEEGRIETSLIRLDALWKRAKELEQDLRARIAAARKMALAAIKAEVPAASATAHGLDVLSVSDADLLGILEAAKSDKTTSTAHISIVGRPPRKIRQRFISFLKAEIRAISFDDGYRALVATTPIAHHLGVDEAALPRSTLYDSSSLSEISRGAGSLIRWSANHAWPAALAAQIQALANVFFGNFIGLKQKYGVPVAGVFVISDSARTLPRKVFERFASMGQFETGHVEVPYHLQDIILAKYLRDASKNRAGLTDIGYASDQVEALHDGHIIGIPFDEIGANTSTFGALPANEINVANPTHLIGTMPETKFLDGWIVDSMYNTLFTALAPDAMGLYGAEDIGRDHFASVRAVISPGDDVRVKHYSIPVFHAHSIDELRTLVGLIGDGAYFRGQTKGYTLDRPLPVRQLLYGSSTAVEPSLVTAASRQASPTIDIIPACN
jgi:uncharacterized protein YjbI with pentapeptide repeats